MGNAVDSTRKHYIAVCVRYDAMGCYGSGVFAMVCYGKNLNLLMHWNRDFISLSSLHFLSEQSTPPSAGPVYMVSCTSIASTA
jgi:hypothetical protein